MYVCVCPQLFISTKSAVMSSLVTRLISGLCKTLSMQCKESNMITVLLTSVKCVLVCAKASSQILDRLFPAHSLNVATFVATCGKVWHVYVCLLDP